MSRRYYGKAGWMGVCTHCGRSATKEALFDGDGITVIEKYCDQCLQPETFQVLQKRYGRN